MEIYTEGAWKKLLSIFPFKEFKKGMRRVERELGNEPDIKADIDALKTAGNNFEQNLKHFCKNHPDHEWCKDKDSEK